MSEDLTEKFRQEGVDESFIRTALLPRIGYRDYTGTVNYTIGPLEHRSFGLDSTLAVITVSNGQGERKLGSFVVKDQRNIPNGINLWGLKETRSTHDRYRLEHQILDLLRDLPVLYADDARNRIIIERWDGSLDSLLDTTHHHIIHARTVTGETTEPVIYLQNRALSYIRGALDALVSVSSRLTEASEDLEKSGVILEEKSVENRTAKLERQLRTIVERSLKNTTPQAQSLVYSALDERLRQGQDLIQELTLLGRELASGSEVIHYDTRSSNFLYRRTIRDATAQELPDPDNTAITLCDFDRARKGPLSHDLAYFLHDPYLLFFLPSRTDRLQWYKEFTGKALSFLRRTRPELAKMGPLSDEFDSLCRQDFNKATIISLIERTANPLEIENVDPVKYQHYVGDRILEDNEEVLGRNLGLLMSQLNSMKSFSSLKYIIRLIQEARKPFPSPQAKST